MKDEKAIGGFFEYELISHISRGQDALLFNSGRSALAYLLRSYEIDFIQIPYYTCDVVLEPLRSLGIEYDFYSLTQELLPDIGSGEIDIDRPILINNYYGILDESLKTLPLKKAVIDNSQAMYSELNGGYGSFNSYRKFMGVPDGGEAKLGGPVKAILDYSEYPRYRCARNLDYLFGRLESGPEEYYDDFKGADKILEFSEIKRVSEVTLRSLDSVDQDRIVHQRIENFRLLEEGLERINQVPLASISNRQVPMAYPLLIEKGSSLRQKLIQERIFVPKFWPNQEILPKKGSYEEHLTENLLPLPIDQRYSELEMSRILKTIEALGY
ncbi:MAG: hypothetical protein HKO93_04770 [Flavobacteriales bacterium]|nr:hypothetical protein [Flavobacteriales bacterium]